MAEEVAEPEEISREALDEALNETLAESLRPVCVGLALFYALLTAWWFYTMEGPGMITMAMSTALFSLGLLAGAVWFERNVLPAQYAHAAAAFIGVAIIVNCLLQLVSIPEARSTTHLMIAQLGFGALLFSQRWFLGLAVLSAWGWGLIAGVRADDPGWFYFGLSFDF